MMSTWIYILLLMMAANGILQAVSLSFYLPAVLAVNIAVLAASYFILRRDPLIDLRANMLFMLGLTAINIRTDLGLMSYGMSWVAFGALFIWSMAGGGRSR